MAARLIQWNMLDGTVLVHRKMPVQGPHGDVYKRQVHTIDGMVWSMNEQLPLAAFGSGGRAQRRDCLLYTARDVLNPARVPL